MSRARGGRGVCRRALASVRRHPDGTSQGDGRARSAPQGALHGPGRPSPRGRVPVSLLRPAASQARSPPRGLLPALPSARHTPPPPGTPRLPCAVPLCQGRPACRRRASRLSDRGGRAGAGATETDSSGRCAPQCAGGTYRPGLRPSTWLSWGPARSAPDGGPRSGSHITVRGTKSQPASADRSPGTSGAQTHHDGRPVTGKARAQPRAGQWPRPAGPHGLGDGAPARPCGGWLAHSTSRGRCVPSRPRTVNSRH